MDGMTICGGMFTGNGNTCITFSSGQWVNSHTLTEDRSEHCSWSTSDGIMLLGGSMWDSQTTTETVRQGEVDSQAGFTLQYRTAYCYFLIRYRQHFLLIFSHACSIHDVTTDTLIITGGNETKKYVTRYDLLGFVEDLPSLNNGRYAHGCGAYLREDGTQVINSNNPTRTVLGFIGSPDTVHGPHNYVHLPRTFPRRAFNEPS